MKANSKAARYLYIALSVSLLLAVFTLTSPGDARAAEATKLMEIPEGLSPAVEGDLKYKREKLADRLEALKLKFNQFDRDCASVEEGSAKDEYCMATAERLTGQLSEYDSDVRKFNRLLSIEDSIAVFTGNAFRMGEQVRQYLRESLDSAKELSRSLIGLWHAERGSYRRARATVGFSDADDTELLRELDDLLLSLELEKRERLRNEVSRTVISGEFDEGLYSQYPKEFGLALLEAFLNTKWRNYDAALEHLAQARDMDIASGAVSEAETYVRQMKASEMERLSPTDPALIEHQRNLASAHAGWSLGLLLYDADMDVAAIDVLSESARTMAEEGDIEDSKVIYELRNHIPKKLPKDESAPESFLTSPGVYDGASEADILLDSLEYGRGDWERSIRFLKLAIEASPGNKNIEKALAHAQALRASQS